MIVSVQAVIKAVLESYLDIARSPSSQEALSILRAGRACLGKRCAAWLGVQCRNKGKGGPAYCILYTSYSAQGCDAEAALVGSCSTV